MGRKKPDSAPGKRLFNDPSGQADMFQKSLQEEIEAKANAPVECLGMTFENDDARRAFFTEKLREKLKDPDFRKTEGFPIGDDEDILRLSDPPFYTACPNPFLADFVRLYGKPYDPNVPYSREPFAVDVSVGKTDPLYKAHSYHTKVPHLAIVPSILHYTEPGDLVLDGFCGSGMTGVAAQWCGSAPQSYREQLEADWKQQGLGKPQWGTRRAILNDLSPAATFIAANYNLPFDVDAFAAAGQRLLDKVDAELGWMYETVHTDGKTKGRIDYTVWSEVFACPQCSQEIVFLDEALDEETKRVRETFPCPHCDAVLTKDALQRVFEARVDPATGEPWRRVKFRPSLISYTAGGARHEKQPDRHDLRLLKKIDALSFPPTLPTLRFPIEQMYHGSRLAPKGFTHVHHLFLPRPAHALASLWEKSIEHSDPRVRHMLLFFVEQAVWGMSLLNRYQPIQHGHPGGSQVNRQMTGVYYVASQYSEVSPRYNLGNKVKNLIGAFSDRVAASGTSAVNTGTASLMALPDNSVDYVFTDPPFGENISYADLNIFIEAWHRVQTNSKPEAVVDRPKGKGLPEYQSLMQRCFAEYRRALKPGRWMTVVFHNSRNSVWNAIQEAMLAAGFVVADVRTLDKQQGSYRQVTSTAVKQDLVISAYKPNGGLEERFKLEAGTEGGVWDFVSTHFRQLPVFVAKGAHAEVIAERQNYLLFDRMVAFHVQRGVTVPLSASEFYAGLAQRFPERDGMYFLPEQAAEYDKMRMTVRDVLQLELFVNDEATAIQWLRQQLTRKPQTFQDLAPQFMQETTAGWEKHEKPLELRELLDESFLCYDGEGEVPSQVHSYLSSNWPDLRKKAKDDPALRAKAKNRWYVPDPGKAQDLEKLRERALLKEFWDYLPPDYTPAPAETTKGFIPGLEPKPEPIPKGKKMKVIRMEAVRVGFRQCWQARDYRTIIAVARRIPESVLQEDPKLLMWYDQAVTRLGGE